MSYDRDLNPVLEKASNEQLQPLVDAILKASVSESLSSDSNYKSFAPDHSKYVDVIADELRRFGGHSIVNLFRGEGPSYFEIVRDVADKLKVKFLESDALAQIEIKILAELISQTVKNLTPEQYQELKHNVDARKIVNHLLKDQDIDKDALSKLSPSAFMIFATVVLSTAARMALISSVGAAGVAASLVGGRLLGILGGPVAWGLTIAYSVYELGGEAYRVTVPCVLQVALLRLFQNSDPEAQQYWLDLNKRKLGLDPKADIKALLELERGKLGYNANASDDESERPAVTAQEQDHIADEDFLRTTFKRRN